MPETSRRTLVTADGVKGLLIKSRLSLVVWALRRVALSRRTCSGFGGFGGSVEAELESVGDRAARYWDTSVFCDATRSISDCSVSCLEGDAMAGKQGLSQ